MAPEHSPDVSCPSWRPTRCIISGGPADPLNVCFHTIVCVLLFASVVSWAVSRARASLRTKYEHHQYHFYCHHEY